MLASVLALLCAGGRADDVKHIAAASEKGGCKWIGKRPMVHGGCLSGKFALDDADKDECVGCPQGYFQDLTNRQSCFQCPRGKHQHYTSQICCLNDITPAPTPAPTTPAPTHRLYKKEGCKVAMQQLFPKKGLWPCVSSNWNCNSTLCKALSTNMIYACTNEVMPKVPVSNIMGGQKFTLAEAFHVEVRLKKSRFCGADLEFLGHPGKHLARYVQIDSNTCFDMVCL